MRVKSPNVEPTELFCWNVKPLVIWAAKQPICQAVSTNSKMSQHRVGKA